MRYEEHKEYAGKGTTALGTIGTILGSIGTAAGTGILNGVLGGGGAVCPDNVPITRYDSGLLQEIATLKTQVALRDSQVYVDQKLADTTAYFNGRITNLEAQLAVQAVQNQKTEDAFALVGERIACCKNEFMAALCRERDDRACADNAIVNYSNATFYPKMVADVTTGTTTTAQTVYNPLPTCGCR
jgi:hypothetical protein